MSIIEHKLVMVGLDNAGKTTILYQFLMNEVVHTSPTIGSNVEEVINTFFSRSNIKFKPTHTFIFSVVYMVISRLFGEISIFLYGI